MAMENDGVLDVGIESHESDAGQPSQGGGNDKAAGKTGKDPEMEALRKENESLRRRTEELTNSERYWAEQARSSTPANGKKKASRDEEDFDGDEDDEDDYNAQDDTPDKIIDDFSAKGIDALVKRGVLTKKAAKEMIRKEAEKVARVIVGQERQKLTQDAELAREFPELQDKDSDLFKRTAEIYRDEVAADPTLKKSTRALMLAARQAKLELQMKNAANGRTRRQQHEETDEDGFGDDEYLDDAESQRISRVRAQSGEGRTRRSSGFDGGNDSLSAEQRKIIAAFNRDGSDLISEEDYKKRAGNIRMGGVPTRRGR